MKDHELARLRLRRQHLTGKALATPEAVVAWLGAVQAQEFAVAKWSIAQRCRGRVTSADLDRALAEGRILRTHLFRATWHFVLPSDLRWLLRLIAPRIHARAKSYYVRNGLTAAVFKRSHAVLREALAGGRQFVRQEIADAFTRGRIDTNGLNLRLLLLQAELDAVLCSGALRGKHQTFALVDNLVPPAAPISEDQALAQLARRYFTSHGPATLKDFIWWSSLSAAQARRALELLKKQGLRAFEAGGRGYWMLEAAARRATTKAPVHLLQPYDEYIIGYTDSRHVLAANGEAIAPIRAPRHPNALIRDGQRIGSWRTALTADEAVVEAQLTQPLDRATRSALETEVERYGRFLQRPVQFVAKARTTTTSNVMAVGRRLSTPKGRARSRSPEEEPHTP